MITRRLFLIGSAAAVMAEAPAVDYEMIVPMYAVRHYRLRKIGGVFVSFNVPDGTPDEAASIELVARSHRMQWCINTRAFLSWLALPNDEINLTAGDTFKIIVDAKRSVGRVDLECLDQIGDEPPRFFLERHEFPIDGPPTVRLIPSMGNPLPRGAAS